MSGNHFIIQACFTLNIKSPENSYFLRNKYSIVSTRSLHVTVPTHKDTLFSVIYTDSD